jgi:putative ABC transport system substrate-binding protein
MQFDQLKRREFITLLGGAAAWPLAARAQQAAMPVIGFLASTSPTAWAPYLTAFKQGLREAGYIEGQNVTIEYRWAEGDYARLPALAADLVRRHVAVLVAVGGSSSAKAAKAASSTIPIVFTTGGDPVGLGLVASLNRPGGNVTGVALLVAEMESKRFGLLRDMVPTATLVAVLLNSRSPVSTTELNDVQEAARAVGQQIHILNASSEQDWTRPSRVLPSSESEHCSLARTLFSTAGVATSSRSPHAQEFQQSTSFASM